MEICIVFKRYIPRAHENKTCIVREVKVSGDLSYLYVDKFGIFPF